MTASVPLVERLAEVLRKWREGRCEHCLRTIASDEDWEQIPEGEGEHLCWDYPTCYLSQADPTEAHARALLPVVEQAVAEARGEAAEDADTLRAVVFRMAEDITRIKRICTQEHPPKMASPTRDWNAGTLTRHSDSSVCVLLNDGDWAITTEESQP